MWSLTGLYAQRSSAQLQEIKWCAIRLVGFVSSFFAYVQAAVTDHVVHSFSVSFLRHPFSYGLFS